MLIINNASFYYVERVKQMCNNIGVKLIYLPLYSLDLNPIKDVTFTL